MRRIILSICLCLYHVFTYAQVNFDEVYKAAKQGNAEAQAYLSWMYITGDGVSQNQTESFKWASKAANQGHAIGCYILGQLYINGQGTQINPIEGSKWMLKAAEKGNVDAFYTLGEIYFNGVGVKKDMTEGFKWFLKAAEQGNVNAQVQVGYMYSDGLGVEKNQEEAFRWTKMAAEVGDAVAQANLSWYYFKGLGTNVDYEESYYWAKKSADQNDELGYENLANCYLVGSRKNIQKAIECMDKAIELCQSSGRAKYDITYLLRMYNKKGNIYLDEKNFVKAEEMAKLIMDINPQYQDEEDNRLMVYTQTGKIVANKANFAQVKRAEPSSDMDVTIALSDWVIEPRYEYAAPFNEGLALVNEPGEKYGYIDVTGNYVVLPRFDTGRNYNNGMATVGIWSNGRLLWGFINKEGKYVVTPKYADAKDYNEGYIPVKDKMTNKWFFVDWYGGPWVGYQYEDANIFIDEKALVKVGKVNAYVNKKGIILCSEKYKEELYVKINREYKDKLKKKNRFICDLIPVKEGNKWGYKKVTLERYISANILPWDLYQSKYLPILESYENYLKSKIEANINKWQKKGEFEPTPKWEKRVNELTRKQKIEELTTIFKEEYENKLSDYKSKYAVLVKDYKEEVDNLQKEYYELIAEKREKDFSRNKFSLMSYDADNQTFMIKSSENGDLLVPVPLNEAADFKRNWNTIQNTITPTFVPSGDDVVLTSVTVTNGNKKYIYDSHTQAKYAVTDINYNFDPVEISIPEVADVNYTFDPVEVIQSTIVQTSPSVKGLEANNATVERKTIDATKQSDVDVNIPQNKMDKNSNTFAVIIANEDYQRVSDVQYASNDGKLFSEYCQKTLGLPQKHVMVYNDATLGNMLSAVSRMKEIGEAYNGKMNVIFYYAGHGIPDETSKDAFLLPVDGDGSSVRTCYKQSELYAELASIKAESVVVFMDACFSGSLRGDGMLASARGVAIKAKKTNPVGNMVVFSAAQGDETAYPYKEQRHGMFTYYLLKKLQETKGEATLGEISDYVTSEVRKQSIVINGKMQTPTLTSSSVIGDAWRNWKLK